MSEKSLFEQFLFEAPGDDPPDMESQPDVATGNDTSTDDNPPDFQEDDGNDPPDMNDEDDSDPPDMGDFGDENSTDQQDDQDQQDDEPDMDADVDNDNNIGLDDKVSAIMNANLYQRFLNLLDKIGNQMQVAKSNMDIFYSVAPDSISIVKSLSALDENVRIYLKDHFPHENYSKNLLFFNKCLNLLKLINDSFDTAVHKGIRETK